MGLQQRASKFQKISRPRPSRPGGGGAVLMQHTELLEGLQSYYKFDELGSVQRLDSISNKHFSVVGSVGSSDDGKISRGALFLGGDTGPDLANSLSAGNVHGYAAYTIGFWHYAVDIHNDIYIVHKYSGSDGYLVYFVDDAPVNHRLRHFNVFNEGGNGLQQTDFELAIGQWYFIVIQWDDADSSMNLWVNNVLEAEDTFPGKTLKQGTTPFKIAGASGVQLEGVMDEMFVYDQKISASRLTTWYNAGAAQRPPIG